MGPALDHGGSRGRKSAADEVLRELDKGADFATLARERSKGARAAEGGELGWVDAEKLPQVLEKAVPRMKVGQTSKALRSGNDYVIVRLADRRDAGLISMAEARPAIEQRVVGAKRAAALMAWLAAQEKRAKIDFADKGGVR